MGEGSLGVLLLGWRRDGASLPSLIPSLAAAGLLLYAVASLVMMHLFLPARYLEHAFRAVFLLIAALALAQGLRWIPWQAARRAALLVVVGWIGTHLFDHRYSQLYDRSEIRSVAEHLSSIPKDALVAAHPRVADDLPTFARRSVFVNYELAHPFLRATYWETLEARTRALLDAYYAERPEDVWAFLRRHGITHLVVDRRHFEPASIQSGALGFAPFDAYVIERVGERTRFALDEIPDDWKRFVDGPFYVLDAAVIPDTAAARAAQRAGPDPSGR